MRVTVFCGTRLENEEKLAKTARAIGNALAKNHIELIYCAPLAGLMREIVNGVFEKEGAVTGIYPSGSFAEDLPSIVTGVLYGYEGGANTTIAGNERCLPCITWWIWYTRGVVINMLFYDSWEIASQANRCVDERSLEGWTEATAKNV